MSRLLARIMLALLMFPLAATVYLLAFAAAWKWMRFANVRDDSAFLIGNLVTAAFVVTYWLLLWRKTVRWTVRRTLVTFGAVILGAMCGTLSGALVQFTIEDDIAVFVGGIVGILVWLLSTLFIWQETKVERGSRLRGLGLDVVACPGCGYNLTGLREASCPECGGKFTVDQLFAAQSSREARELARIIRRWLMPRGT
jgi:hypothetical protein